MSTPPPPPLPIRPRIMAPVAGSASPDPLAQLDPTERIERAPPSADSYIRDPHKLIAYIIPFPAPSFSSEVAPAPVRFLIYTPPPPPLERPDAGEKEDTKNKIQRKWQEEVRTAHNSNHKVMSWHGIKARVTKGVSWGVSHVTTADLDFLTRVPQDGEKHLGGRTDSARSSGVATPTTPTIAVNQPAGTPAAAAPVTTSLPSVRTPAAAKAAEAAEVAALSAAPSEALPAYSETADPSTSVYSADTKGPSPPPLPARKSLDPTAASSDNTLAAQTESLAIVEDSPETDTTPTRATVKLEEIVLVYPPDMGLTETQLREEFVNSLLRTKSKAQRDAVIATGLLPVTAALDWMLMFVGWVFGGALEIDAVWAAASYRGAKTARSVTKRLASSGDGQLKLVFTPSQRASVVAEFLNDKCVAQDHDRFAARRNVPSAHTVLEAIGWESSGRWENQNWEDEKWERDQVEKDLDTTMAKAAGGWTKWCDKYEKNPQKAVKK